MPPLAPEVSWLSVSLAWGPNPPRIRYCESNQETFMLRVDKYMNACKYICSEGGAVVPHMAWSHVWLMTPLPYKGDVHPLSLYLTNGEQHVVHSSAINNATRLMAEETNVWKSVHPLELLFRCAGRQKEKAYLLTGAKLLILSAQVRSCFAETHTLNCEIHSQ